MKKHIVLLISIIILNSNLMINSLGENLLKNSGFESILNGSPMYWENNIVTPPPQNSPAKIPKITGDSYDGSQCLKIINYNKEWLEYTQTVDIDSNNNYYITLGVYAEIVRIIPGKEDWETFGITLTFLDENNAVLDNIIDLARWKQKRYWSYYQDYYVIPKNTKKCRVTISLGNCEGEVKIDDISLKYGKIEIIEDLTNLVQNSGFEYGNSSPSDWHYWANDESQLLYPGNQSNRCFYLFSKENKFYNIDQKIDISKYDINEIEINADYKIENVTLGENPWESAQIMIAFCDENQQHLPGSPIVLDQADGNFSEWKSISNKIKVPERAAGIEFIAALINVPGKLWLDNVVVKGFDASGKIISRNKNEAANYSNWLKFESNHNIPAAFPDIDISYLLDAPAGKHGYCKNDNGIISFEDGTRARFFGFNIALENVKLSHEYSEKLAKRLASIGCNMVRIHLEVPTEEYYDNFDFLVSELIKNGIYIYMDLFYDKKYGEKDGLSDASSDTPVGLKGVTYFDENIIQFEKNYIKNFLNHKNPFTEKQYKNEPAIVCLNILNESSLFYFDYIETVSDLHRNKLTQLFNNWLKTKYETTENLINSWQNYGELQLDENESLENMNIRRAGFQFDYENWQNSGSSPDSIGRIRDTKLFYHELQKNFYNMMYEYIRSFEYKGLICGSNHWERFEADLYSYSQMDIIDHHHYFDHPNPVKGFGPLDIEFKNNQILKSLSNMVSGTASKKNKDLPLFVSEWGITYPNEYRFTGPVLMASYGCLQDWDGILQVSFDSDGWPDKIDDIFDVSQSPSVLSQWIAAALIFHLGYIKPSYLQFEDQIGEEDIFNSKESSFKYVGNNVFLSLISRVQKKYSLSQDSAYSDPQGVLDQFYKPEYGFIMSDTYELLWNYDKGYLVLNSDYVQGIIGNFADEIIELNDISITPYSTEGSIILVSMDSKPIGESDNMLLITSGKEMNQDGEFHSSDTYLLSNGRSPICLKPVECQILFKTRTDLKIDFYNIDGIKNWFSVDLNEYENKFDFIKDFNTIFYKILSK